MLPGSEVSSFPGHAETFLDISFLQQHGVVLKLNSKYLAIGPQTDKLVR